MYIHIYIYGSCKALAKVLNGDPCPWVRLVFGYGQYHDNHSCSGRVDLIMVSRGLIASSRLDRNRQWWHGSRNTCDTLNTLRDSEVNVLAPSLTQPASWTDRL